ncbi:Methyltransferase domain-containing protein [Thalassovita litoralis]|jgi:SAM-dependent methyltransferase|uniref:Methyltransferase domain-containing protein n=1 Tax=Thalassovita litoralis TaxID=1010611 RepID=A0A521EEA0_9RHOB|nr:class I SAM-dependent methyltransferase [Thalassovita litoralis]SMO82172.1 Methyltransferase domain-containing protein [Thalassovita litoralis]
MTIDPETIRIYDAQADEYARVTASDQPDPFLQSFMDAVPAGGQVLDLGCGPGNFARHMVRAGLHVTAVDASAEMVARAGQIDGVTARQATFDDLTDTAIYHGVWANFSLLHAPRAAMPRHLAAIHHALKPKGRFHLALKTGMGEKRDRLGRFYTYYTPEEVSSLLAAAGFTVTKITPGRDKGLDGAESDWISVASHA